jgi:hypothetical protein
MSVGGLVPLPQREPGREIWRGRPLAPQHTAWPQACRLGGVVAKVVAAGKRIHSASRRAGGAA